MKKSNKEEFVAKARLVHGNKYDYSFVVYERSNEKVIILCKEHGTFLQSPNHHLKGRNCPKCALIKNADGLRLSRNYFIDKAKSVHGDKYDYSLSQYVDSRTRISIVCEKHGVFNQSPSMHLSGQGCPKCANDLTSERQLLDTDTFIDRAVSIHGDKYDYSLVKYAGSHEYVDIICEEHGVFKQWPSSHLMGRGCVLCAKYGFDNRKPGHVYVFNIDGITKFTGYGITTDIKQRRTSHKSVLKDHGYFIENSYISPPLQGIQAQQLERELKQHFLLSVCSKDIPGFKRESTTAPFHEVVAFVQQYIEQHKEPHGDDRLN